MSNFAVPDEDSNIMEELKRFWKDAQKDRYKTLGGWFFDRWIFTTALVLVFGWLLFVAWSYDFELNYYKCEGPASIEGRYIGTDNPAAVAGCKNPFYKPATWENSEYLLPGEYGTKLGPLFQSVYYVPVVLLALAILLNHRIHNRMVGVKKK